MHKRYLPEQFHSFDKNGVCEECQISRREIRENSLEIDPAARLAEVLQTKPSQNLKTE